MRRSPTIEVPAEVLAIVPGPEHENSTTVDPESAAFEEFPDRLATSRYWPNIPLGSRKKER